MRLRLFLVTSLFALIAAHVCIGADAGIDKSIERAKDKRQQEIERAGVAYRSSADRANATLAKILETAAATAKKKKDDAKAESFTASAQAAKAGEPVSGDTGDKLVDGAIKRRAGELEQADKTFKAAVARANDALEKSYELAIASYKKKSDPRAEELAKEIGEIKAAEVTPPGVGESASASSKSPPGHLELIKAVGDSVVTADGKSVSSKALASQDYTLVYFSAHWCGPCRAFTPDLVKFHNDFSKTGKFEVIFVSSDRSEKDMLGYMTEAKMPWVAVPYNKVGASGLSAKHGVNGIPHLALMDKDGKIISSAVENGQYVGPRKVLADLKAKLGAK